MKNSIHLDPVMKTSLQGMLGDFIFWWAASFAWQLTMADGIVVVLQCMIPTQPIEELKIGKCMLLRKLSMKNIGTWYPRPRLVCQVYPAFGLFGHVMFTWKPYYIPYDGSNVVWSWTKLPSAICMRYLYGEIYHIFRISGIMNLIGKCCRTMALYF